MVSRRKLLVVLLFTGSCGAQVQLTLQDALKRALDANPLIAAAQGRSDQARGQQTQARLRPNPRLFLQTEDVRWWGTPAAPYWQSTEEYAYLGQVVETGGKRAKRVDLASSDLRATEISEDLQKRQIRVRVSNTYWAAIGATQVQQLYQRTLRTYDEDVTYSDNRVREGVMAEADLMRLRLERRLVEAQATGATREAQQAMVELYRAMGQTEFPPTTLTEPLQASQPEGVPALEETLKSRPEERIAREQIQRAEANVRLQRSMAKPDPEVYAGYKRNVGQDTLYAAVQIDLPIRNRNQGNIGSAQAEERIAEANLRTTEANIRADIAAATEAYRNNRTLLEGLTATREQASESERLARGAYREGGIDLLHLLDVERSHISIEMQYIRTLVEVNQSVVNLQFATGQGGSQ